METVLSILTGKPLFTNQDFLEINQLADLLFNEMELSIQLNSEHELVTRAWILSALNQSELAKKCANSPKIYLTSKKNEWTYWGKGKLTRDKPEKKETIALTLPMLNFDQRLQILHNYCLENLETHLLVIPISTIKKALEWQSAYCSDKELLSKTIFLIQRAVNRFLLTFTEREQIATLEEKQVAEVLVDWEYVDINYLLRDRSNENLLKTFLEEHIIGQKEAIEKFLKHRFSNKIMVLAGPAYSGKTTFIESYTLFIHAAKHFVIPFDLAYYSHDLDWNDIFLTEPKINAYKKISLIDIVSNYPNVVFLLKNINENPVLLKRLEREIYRGFFQIKKTCISIENVTWIFNLEIDCSISHFSSSSEEDSFNHDSVIDLSDILYQSSVKISDEESEKEWIKNPQDMIKEAKKMLPEFLFSSTYILPFFPLSEKDKRKMINNEIKRIINRLRSKYNVSLYYQEEVINFLLSKINQEKKGFDDLHKNLYIQVEKILLKVLDKGLVIDGQVLMLQLNETGKVLQIIKAEMKNNTNKISLS